ncbi:MAG: polysaccharide biosynthesis C-terminal domain-containing protein [Methyloligellaceae bacterium]
MKIGARITYGVMASWLNRAVAIVLNLVLMPVLFRYMGREELGLWFLLGQSGAFLALMDFGLTPTLIRRIAFANSETHSLEHDEKIDEYYDSGSVTVAELITVSALIYRCMAVGVFLLSWGAGLLFLEQLGLGEELYHNVFWAWTILSLGYAFNVWVGYWPCLLQGLGYVSANLYIGMTINILVAVSQIVIVLMGGGIVELALSFIAGSVLTRCVTVMFLYIKNPLVRRKSRHWRGDIFSDLFRPAIKAWITVLGGFLVIKTDQYFIAVFKGAQEIPAYHAAYQLTSNLYMLAVALAGSSSVFVSYLWQEQRYNQVRNIAIRSLQSGLSIMACGIVCLVLVGEAIIHSWLGAGNFIGGPVLMVFCIMLFLQVQHEMFMTLSRATEDEAYALVSLMAGGLNLLLTYFLIQLMGLPGVALGTLLAQLFTNNWYGVYRGTKRLGISLRSYILEIVFPVAGVLVVAFYTAGYAVSLASTAEVQIYNIIAAVLASGLVLFCALLIFLAPGSIRYINPIYRKRMIR